MLKAAMDFAIELANAARPIIIQYFRTPNIVDIKYDNTPVTIADRRIEKIMRAMIEDKFPDHGIASEEFAPKNLDAEYVWSLDPIDGTKAFIAGRPSFGTMIGLLHMGNPILGLIDCPILNERWIGGPEVTTTINGNKLMSLVHKTLDQAILTVTSPDMFNCLDAEIFNALKSKCKLTLFSGDCHNFCLLAFGTIDLVVESNLKDYDYLAPSAIITGAGGLLTDWSGLPVKLGSTTHIVAARNHSLHSAAVKILSTKEIKSKAFSSYQQS
ncbi:inositol-1-monophosphatase, putative [Candidatus Endolissoclinum faulkneri L5]|uniref:Inositol-1-monophosphatase, putative n=1 Tax=Candidatus Endolissoclinum faulkneri L5 TaxID=1401328 RepID=V9TUS4_9PROT|nr:inositol monophosphatase family protein [Candidatus Endolissoclinum faulkneri]AHC73443.1 inositol-1-monophosphatase, putative [Candidatus Endolissoclinum faulkneri L5]